MSDEQLVAEWVRMLNEAIPPPLPFSKRTGPIWWDVTIAGRQAMAVDSTKPITREQLVARVEQLIVGRVNDRLQGS